jgi:predicted LPLAT superfamily acyltransferase
MSEPWLEQQERGTLFAFRLIAWLTRHGGYAVGRLLLYPICIYFIVFSIGARRASREYLRRVLGRRASFRDVFRHYHTFASTILDRIVFAGGDLNAFDLRVRGADALRDALAGGRGCLLIGAHVGSFELVRAAAATQPGLVVNVVMHEANAGKMAEWMRTAAKDHAARIIPAAEVGTMLRVRECLARGEIVAMLGDRPMRGATVLVDFLGAPARLPAGPFRLARALDVPIVTFIGLYRAPRCYDLCFEPLAADPAAQDPTTALVRCFGERLQRTVRQSPFNWFNFYDYWRLA